MWPIKRILKSKIVLIIVGFVLSIIILDKLFPLPQLKPYSKVITAKDGTLLSAYLSSDDKWRMRTRLDEVSPYLIRAIIEKEDSWFYWHPGINPFAVLRALYSNITSGRRVSGASTITMQLARMMDPAERTYANKFIEMLRAVQLELHYSKREILEMYLSYLPFGGNVEGVKSASYIYFNRPPDKLSLAQSIMLAVIPNDPNMLRPDRTVPQSISYRNYWINKFIKDKAFPVNDLKDALSEPLNSQRYAIPNNAPHFSYYVANNYKSDELKTTLNPRIQAIAEKLLLNYVNRVKPLEVSNGAVLVIDNKSSSVAAYCGSADFYDNQASGQVNGVEAVRSPGSTLKPGLYALAMDRGLITPKMKLLDIPTDFTGYEPENYDQKFHGDVTVDYALINSLNVPAVRLLREVNIGQYIKILTKSGFDEIASAKDKLGLSLILGGCGVRLDELTRFFSTFAHEGELYPLNYLGSDVDHNKNAKGIKIFSPGAAYIIAQILSSNERPDVPNELLYSTKLPRIAWKTGTSYGKRDAWAVGFNPDYTIGVWMGNFDGKGSPELSGAEMAVPLLFDLFNSIGFNPKSQWFIRPEDVGRRTVCSETGMLPSEYCKNTTEDYYIKDVSPHKICDLYKEVYISEDEKTGYCPECLPNTGYKKKAYPFYDPELVLWYDKNNVKYPKPPPHNKNCKARFTGEGLKIISPSPDYEYLIESGSGQQILLQAASDINVQEQYWYINDAYYKKCKPGEKVFFKPENSKIKISCMDDKGRTSFITINVKYY